MQLVQLLIKQETAYPLIKSLGQLSAIQFLDLNAGKPNILRDYHNDVKKFDKLERTVRKFEAVTIGLPEPPKDANYLLQSEDNDNIENGSIDAIEEEILENSIKLNDLVENEQNLKRRWFELIEFQHNLETVKKYLKDKAFNQDKNSNSSSSSGSGSDSTSSELNANKLNSDEDLIELDEFKKDKTNNDKEQSTKIDQKKIEAIDSTNIYDQYLKFSIVTGTISTESRGRVEKLLWRGTKGNAYVSFWDITDPIYNPVKKQNEFRTVFVVYYSGDFLRNRITKIVESFNAKVFNVASTDEERKEQLDDVKTQLSDLKTTLSQTKVFMNKFQKFLQVRIIPWYRRILIEKATYHTLNMLSKDSNKQYLVAKGWVRLSKLESFREVINGDEDEFGENGTILNTLDNEEGLIEPTYIDCKEYQESTQKLVSSFFIPKYREINPAPIMLVTFPFLFSVMFSDLGHGILLTLFALFLFKTYDAYKVSHLHSLIQMFYDARHLILTMGISSCFIGIMYNEFFAAPMHLFNSCWEPDKNSTLSYNLRYEHCTYPFGVDPEWANKSNWLIFFNSFKMKNAVVFGFFQVTLGMIIALINCIYKKKYLEIFFDVIPRIIVLFASTGYMCFLIIYKWGIDWSTRKGQEGGIKIITTLIDLAFGFGKVDDDSAFFYNQESLQKTLVAFIFIGIIVLWFALPIIKFFQMRRKNKLYTLGEIEYEDFEKFKSKYTGFTDLFVNQSIIAMEFALGILSNTASYTRLWALSLSHSELSAIFWDKLIMYPLSTNVPGFLVITFFFWVGFTLFVLMMSEGLSAFLHTLRLHWIEFFSKFVDDENGIEFRPFSFKLSFQNNSEFEDEI
ncbi:v-type proton atpase subunit a [Anaeramoeba flamelloides]|nr:v-type proton atpase subunit a [Anaeramoeba flamelloides]